MKGGLRTKESLVRAARRRKDSEGIERRIEELGGGEKGGRWIEKVGSLAVGNTTTGSGILLQSSGK